MKTAHFFTRGAARESGSRCPQRESTLRAERANSGHAAGAPALTPSGPPISERDLELRDEPPAKARRDTPGF
jgi:hypothetical protein